MTLEQNLSQAPEADTLGDGSLDAAALAFEKRETQPVEEEQSESEVEAADTEVEATDDDPNAETDDGESDEDTGEVELAEVEYEGKTYKVPPELQKALLRQSDYSRKMNEVAQQEKVYKSRVEQAETLVKGAEQLAASLAEVKLLDARLKQYESVNWSQLRTENPAEFAALASELQMLRLSRQEAEGKARMIGAQVEEARNGSLVSERAEMFKRLESDLKGWNNEMGEKITAYAVNNGVKFETLASVTDHGLIVALEKARRYDELQGAKKQIKEKVQAKALPPVLKPGAPRKPAPAVDAMARLRKSNSVDDAAAAFLAKMR